MSELIRSQSSVRGRPFSARLTVAREPVSIGCSPLSRSFALLPRSLGSRSCWGGRPAAGAGPPTLVTRALGTESIRGWAWLGHTFLAFTSKQSERSASKRSLSKRFVSELSEFCWSAAGTFPRGQVVTQPRYTVVAVAGKDISRLFGSG